MSRILRILGTCTLTLAAGISPGQITSFVTFGDSYTDIVNVGDGGTAWPVYLAGYTNTTLHPFARSGGTCSNLITPRPFPSIMESQLPAYFAAVQNDSLQVEAESTLYTQWIGTNDVGVYSLMTGSNAASIVDVETCKVEWVKMLYESGARNFLVQNMVPLNDSIVYAPYWYPNRYYPNEHNATQWGVYMAELVLSGNKINELMLEALAPTLPDAHIGIFDSYSLFSDIFQKPGDFLNGTAPLNVTGCVAPCVYDSSNPSNEPVCTSVNGTDRDSFLWYDELHPSEQADRVVAAQIAEVMTTGENKYTRWLS